MTDLSRSLDRTLGWITGARRPPPGTLGRRLVADLGMVGDRLLWARKPSPTVALPPTPESVGPEASPSAIEARKVRVSRIVAETKDTISIVFNEVGGALTPFEAGQFITVEATVRGERLRRAYSLSTIPRPDSSRAFTVKRIPGGRMSGHLHERIREGSLLSVLGPSGSFTASAAPKESLHYVMLAGGSGITPVIAILEDTLRSRSDVEVTLIYGNRDLENVIFRDRLDVLAREFPKRLELAHVLEEGKLPEGGRRGRLDRAVALETLGDLGIDGRSAETFFVCGPAGMMDEVRAALASLNVAADRVLEESFGRPDSRKEAAGADASVPVRVEGRGQALDLVVAPGETVLEAGARQGIALPFSCAMGGCGACKVKATPGTIEMDEPNCLTDAERTEGYVLTCVGRPTRACSLTL